MKKGKKMLSMVMAASMLGSLAMGSGVMAEEPVTITFRDTNAGDERTEYYMQLISDFEAFYPAADREIVLGATTRTEGTPYAERIAALGSGEYELALMEEGSRIFLLFSDSEGLMAACEALLAEV